MIQVSASILAAPLTSLSTVIPKLKQNAIDLIHLDVMDGNFVPQISFGEALCKEVKSLTKIPLDIHLMVNNPEKEVPKYFALKPQYITFHIEATNFPIRLAEEIKKQGIKVGVAINPSTPASRINTILPYMDLLLLMTVEPGFYGQNFIKTGLEKINRAKEIIGSYPIVIEVDGGVNLNNIERISEFGAKIVVAGSALFHDGKANENALKLKKLTK